MTQATAVRIGTASAPIHHGEIMQGSFRVGGRIRRGLVTLPCPLHRTQATFITDRSGAVRVRPAWREKARRAAELALHEIAPGTGGCLTVHSDVPLSRGLGSSTSDVLAAIWSVADSFGRALPATTVARLAVQAEQASDSLMFSQVTVLFAHRLGELIEDFGAALPSLHVLGFGAGEQVDTLSYRPARYTERELDRFEELRSMLRQAIADQDAELVGQVATASTWINQRYLPIPRLGDVCAAATAAGAVGVQTAHSGDISGILFDRRACDLDDRVEMAQKLLQSLGHNDQWRFNADA
jgi:uncharacterized protein involved in propanediol utilization